MIMINIVMLEFCIDFFRFFVQQFCKKEFFELAITIFDLLKIYILIWDGGKIKITVYVSKVMIWVILNFYAVSNIIKEIKIIKL